jgi:hypothetical protein
MKPAVASSVKPFSCGHSEGGDGETPSRDTLLTIWDIVVLARKLKATGREMQMMQEDLKRLVCAPRDVLEDVSDGAYYIVTKILPIMAADDSASDAKIDSLLKEFGLNRSAILYLPPQSGSGSGNGRS